MTEAPRSLHRLVMDIRDLQKLELSEKLDSLLQLAHPFAIDVVYNSWSRLSSEEVAELLMRIHARAGTKSIVYHDLNEGYSYDSRETIEYSFDRFLE
jgi:hypothetical protein